MGNVPGHALQNKRGIALRKRDDRSYDKTKKFQEIIEEEWNARVNPSAVVVVVVNNCFTSLFGTKGLFDLIVECVKKNDI